MSVNSDGGACFLIAVLVVLFYGEPDLWDKTMAYLDAKTVQAKTQSEGFQHGNSN